MQAEKNDSRRSRGGDRLTRVSVGMTVGLILALGAGFGVAGASQTEELYSPFLPATRASAPGTGDAPDASIGESQEERVRTAVGLVRRGQYAVAADLLAPYSVTEDFLALHALGVAYVRLGRNQEAYTILLRAHHLRPAVPGPLLPAALACARMARTCDDYRELALRYKATGGRFTLFADRIANHLPITLSIPRR